MTNKVMPNTIISQKITLYRSATSLTVSTMRLEIDSGRKGTMADPVSSGAEATSPSKRDALLWTSGPIQSAEAAACHSIVLHVDVVCLCSLTCAVTPPFQISGDIFSRGANLPLSWDLSELLPDEQSPSGSGERSYFVSAVIGEGGGTKARRGRDVASCYRLQLHLVSLSHL